MIYLNVVGAYNLHYGRPAIWMRRATSLPLPMAKPGRKQYNTRVGTWSDYHAGKVKKFDGGKCFTTGYSWGENQGGLKASSVKLG